MKFSIAKGKTTLIDKADYERVSKYRWSFNNGAVATNIQLDNGKRTTLKLHRYILGLPLNRPIVDHINNNPLDNRRVNLRTTTHSNNLLNRGKNKNNKSGYKGVFYHKTAKKWTAQISIRGNKKHLGLFNTPEQAYQQYIKQSKKLHKEYAHA